MRSTLLALASAALFALPAHAVTLESATLAGNALDTSFSTSSLISLDLSIWNHDVLSFDFAVDADDIAAGSVSFNSIVRDVSGLGFGSLSIMLNKGDFTIPTDSLRAATVEGDLLTSDYFSGAMVTEFYIGNPFIEDGVSDWTIGFSGMNAGDTFRLNIGVTPAVPEPADWAMLLAGLGMIVLSAARRIGR